MSSESNTTAVFGSQLPFRIVRLVEASFAVSVVLLLYTDMSFPTLPFMVLLTLAKKPKHRVLESYAMQALMALVMMCYHGILFSVLVWPVVGYMEPDDLTWLFKACTLAMHLPFYVVLGRSHSAVLSRSMNQVEATALRCTWDPPLLCMVYAMSLIGRRFLHDGKGQWMTLMDDQIAVSSLPLASDLPEMQAAGVIGVVNMCAETAGPADAYEEAGIQMIRCPILDTNAPDLDTIKRATFFITQKLAAHPGKRVLIHCKGGRGRAATIALCYYISQGGVPADIIKMLKAKRDTVEPIVLQYNSVVQFAHLVKEAQTTK